MNHDIKFYQCALKLPEFIDGIKNVRCTRCGEQSGHHEAKEPSKSPDFARVECPGFRHKYYGVAPCPYNEHIKASEKLWGDRVFERNDEAKSRFAACDAHQDIYTGSYYTEIKDENPDFKFPEEIKEEETKKMPTHSYGINQQMLARFPGKCYLCSGKIQEQVDTILPILSVRTPRGRHPWVHQKCYAADTSGVPVNVHGSERQDSDDGDIPLPSSSRFLVDPPLVSQRQISVVGKNLEAVLRALANNPSQAYALVPVVDEGYEAKPVLTTEAILPPKKPATEVQAEAVSASA